MLQMAGISGPSVMEVTNKQNERNKQMENLQSSGI